MTAVEVQNVSKIYTMDKVSLKAVDKASFKIEAGAFSAISGPSGSGKSTLLNLIGLIDLPSEGKILLNGHDIYENLDFSKVKGLPSALDKKLTELRRTNLGFIFQTFNLVPVLNVRENIEFPLNLGKSNTNESLSPAKKKDWVDFLIEKVGLTDWAKHKPSELSGGQRQRVAIARALVTKASIILADEPTANLDSKNGDQILDLMKQLNEELKTTFIFSTHDSKIVNMASQVIKISDGKIL